MGGRASPRESIEEHQRRFQPGGTYDQMPFQEWALIDFHRGDKKLIAPKPRFWHALYDQDLSGATIMSTPVPAPGLGLQFSSRTYIQDYVGSAYLL